MLIIVIWLTIVIVAFLVALLLMVHFHCRALTRASTATAALGLWLMLFGNILTLGIGYEGPPSGEEIRQTTGAVINLLGLGLFVGGLIWFAFREPKKSDTDNLMAAYMTRAVLLSSIDITYKWLSPLVSMGEAVDWSATAGLQAGFLGTNNNEGWFGGGLVTDIHLPQFFPLPLFAIGGPEGGGIGVSVWFIGLLAWRIHLRLRRFRSPATIPGDDLGASGPKLSGLS